MRKRWFLIIVALLNASILWLWAFHPGAPASAAGKLRYVAQGGDCAGAKPCYASPQEALDAAKDSDEIRIAMGVYTEVHPHAPP
jgi:hypothetical protein